MKEPHVSEALLEWLEDLFPDTVPAPGQGVEEFHRKQGEQRVIRKLQAVHEEQNENILEA